MDWTVRKRFGIVSNDKIKVNKERVIEYRTFKSAIKSQKATRSQLILSVSP